MAAVAELARPSEPLDGSRPKLPVSMLQLEEAHRRRHYYTVAPHVSKEDPLYPGFWGNVAKHLRRHDIVFLVNEENGWELECRVEQVSLSGAEVSITKNISRQPIKQAENWIDTEHHTQWRPGHGWCVVRAKDGHAIISGHTIEASAVNQFHRERPRAA